MRKMQHKLFLEHIKLSRKSATSLAINYPPKMLTYNLPSLWKSFAHLFASSWRLTSTNINTQGCTHTHTETRRHHWVCPLCKFKQLLRRKQFPRLIYFPCAFAIFFCIFRFAFAWHSPRQVLGASTSIVVLGSQGKHLLKARTDFKVLIKSRYG